MSVHLYLAPAGGGKTAYLVERARAYARDAAHAPRVVVSTRLQVAAWRRQLAEAGGALGVRVTTFEPLYAEILRATGQVYVLLGEPVQYRLLRTLIDDLPLEHYAPLRGFPGFAQVVLDLVRELKAGGVDPLAFGEAVETMGGEPRLAELARLYAAYQARLQAEGWADHAGLGWLAAEALERRADAPLEWPVVMMDGFDDLTTVQERVLRQIVRHTDELIVALTGSIDGPPRPQALGHLSDVRRRLEDALGVAAEPLPAWPGVALRRAPALAQLEASLFSGGADRCPAGDAVTLVAAPDREGEVRAALRWLKSQVIGRGLRLGEVALLARDMVPYQAYVRQVAAEYGLPLYVPAGWPLRGNPAIAALLDLLRLPVEDGLAWAWRPTVEAWRCPYFDWLACAAPGEQGPIGIRPEDADALDRVARAMSVIGGLDQWEDAFALLSRLRGEALDEEAPVLPTALDAGAVAALHLKFQRFVRRVSPPEDMASFRGFVAWLEGLIGSDEPDAHGLASDLGVAQRILDGPPELVERDLAALNALKDVLRGLVWAEAAVGSSPTGYADLLRELEGAVDAAAYHLAPPTDHDALLAATVTRARGLAFRAVAVLGLAEGEFPATLDEDPFLRDADRGRLREEFGLSIELSTSSAEGQYFYEAVTRPCQALLLTRPRIADNGAPWQASPFWEEVRRCVEVTPRRLPAGSHPQVDEAASWSELLLTAARSSDGLAWEWAARRQPERCQAIEYGRTIVERRTRPPIETPDPYDGGLTSWGDVFAQHHAPERVWSASRIESYRTCPFSFYVGSVLGLAPRPQPAEGLDARQLGNIYHRILEQVYREARDPTSLEALLAALKEVAPRVLDEAPRREQFRATRWWEHTRLEIERNVRRTLEAMDAARGAYVPWRFEAAFGMRAQPALVVQDGDDAFCLRGLIDRVDRAPDGRVRIIDYKTAGPYGFTDRAFKEGVKLQIALYALATGSALGLGRVEDGFYWHVRHAEQSRFSLARYGVSQALDLARQHAWEAVRGARAGRYTPLPPHDGCPAYCPAAAFCWRYAPHAY